MVDFNTRRTQVKQGNDGLLQPEELPKAYVGPKGPAPKLFVPMDTLINVQIVHDANGHTSEGGLIMPDTVSWRNPVYYVIAKGPKCSQVEDGDHIICSPEVQLQIIRYAGHETLLIREAHVQGVVIKSDMSKPKVG